jgi:hypothetical protein
VGSLEQRRQNKAVLVPFELELNAKRPLRPN